MNVGDAPGVLSAGGRGLAVTIHIFSSPAFSLFMYRTILYHIEAAVLTSRDLQLSPERAVVTSFFDAGSTNRKLRSRRNHNLRLSVVVSQNMLHTVASRN
jgi:hypothetical protein